MSDIFTEHHDAFQALMAGTGGVASAAPSRFPTSQMEDDHDDGMTHSCGCNGGAPCGGCGGNISKSSPAYRTLQWGMLVSQGIDDPFWKMASVGQTLQDAPSRSQAPEWSAIDTIVQRTQDVGTVAKQGVNASMARSRLMKSTPITFPPIQDSAEAKVDEFRDIPETVIEPSYDQVNWGEEPTGLLSAGYHHFCKCSYNMSKAGGNKIVDMLDTCFYGECDVDAKNVEATLRDCRTLCERKAEKWANTSLGDGESMNLGTHIECRGAEDGSTSLWYKDKKIAGHCSFQFTLRGAGVACVETCK